MQIFEYLVDALKKHDVSNFKSWLHVTTRNHCLMQLRKDNREVLAENLSYSIVEYATDEHHTNEDLEYDLQKLEDCVEQLKNEQQDCVRLFYLEKRSYVEISDQTGHPIKKVKSYIQNGRRNLKICMESK